ncbi:MAG: aldo/keto reductase, partial [Candidatus Methylomirabilis sp.]|nr:aldo/keto reductase [Deltaproteobacteria bacterium]
YSPIEQGVLTGKVTLDRKYAEDDERPARAWFQPGNLARVLAALEEVKPIARDLGATLAQVCIAWVNAQPGVTASIVGARTPEQVDENAGAGALRLSPDVVARLTKIYESIGEPERKLVRSRVFK